MIFKSQLKTKTGAISAWFQTSLTPHAPFPSTKPLLELVHGRIKIRSEAKSNRPPIRHFCKSAKRKKDRERDNKKGSFFFLHFPSKGNDVCNKRKKTEGDQGRERGQNEDVPGRGSCGDTGAEAPCTGYTQVLDRQTTTTSRSCWMLIYSRWRSKHLADDIRRPPEKDV